MTLVQSINCKLVLMLSSSPIIRFIITMIIIIGMRIYFYNIIYAEGIPMEAFEHVIYLKDLEVDFIDKEAKIVAKYNADEALAKYTEKPTKRNEYSMTIRAKALAKLEDQSVQRAIEYAKRLQEERAAYNKAIIPEIDLTNVEAKPEAKPETKPEAITIKKSIEVPKEPISIPKPKLVENPTEPIVKYESRIGSFLADMQKDDPKQLKTILKWYMESGLSVNKLINHPTTDYIKFIADLGLMCYENKIQVGDEQTTSFLVIGSYYDQDVELYNIARAYIHLAYYNQDLNNEVKLNSEVFNKQFTNATLKIEEIHKYLRNKDAKKH
jgi:hypothetical protein